MKRYLLTLSILLAVPAKTIVSLTLFGSIAFCQYLPFPGHVNSKSTGVTFVNADSLYAASGCVGGMINTGVTFTAGSGYTIPTGGSNLILAMEYKLTPTTASQTADLAFSGSTGGVMSLVALKP